MNKNQNTIIVINGATGSGKTYAGLTICENVSKMFNTNFSIKDNVSFKFSELLKKMRLPKNAVPKTCFLLEEIGAFGSGGSSREWQSQANKFFFSFLQTNRCKNQILIITTPSFNYLEAGARKLVHFQLESIKINFTEKLSYFKPHLLQVNQRKGTIYFKFLRFTTGNIRRRLNRCGFELPSSNIIIEYEKIKDKYVNDLNKTILDLTEEKKGFKKNNINYKKECGVRDIKAGHLLKDIAKKHNVSTKTVGRWKKEL